ncbi:uncharacterized protein J3R85_019306 [Psidium guajava]|nr:uncharacterized protein J3R85_019306 [Psidium guajava]
MSMEVDKSIDEMTSPMDSLEHEGEEVFGEEVGTNKVSHDCPTATGKRKGSTAWFHFRKGNKDKNGKTEVFCKYCGATYKYCVDNGTSAMLKHLNRCNKYPRNIDKKQKLFIPLRTQKLSKENTDTGSANVLSTWEFDQERCRQMLVRMLVVDEQPFSLVERVGFRDFISQLQPLFNPISRFTVVRDCMKLYHAERISLKTFFRNLKSRVALTTDTWSSIQNLNYLCLTAHFISDDWRLHKRIINFVVMSSHKGKDIGKMIEKCIYEWGIEKNVSTITVDNASSNDVAIKFLKAKFLKDKLLILDGEALHMRCTAHILNLIVRDGLHEVRDSITRIRNVVRYVRGSPMRAKSFQACIESARITYKGSVCLDVSTRWNSTYLMLDTALKLRKAFERLEEDDPFISAELEEEIPKNEDWENARVLVIFLKKFYDSTNKMSGTLYITSNDYFDEIAGLYKTLKQAENASDARVRAMGVKMKEKFDKYYGSFDKVNMMVLIAVILDPRKKMKYVRYCYKLIYDDDEIVNERCDYVRTYLERLFNFFEKSCGSTSSGQLSIDAGCSLNLDSYEVGRKDEVGFTTDFDVTFDGDKAFEYFMNEEKKVAEGNLSEIEKYLQAPREEGRNLDILMWWNTAGQKYKIISLMARDILAIPVTTVASESTFSTSGRVLDSYRSSLTPRVVEALICTQDWLRVVNKPVNVEECIETAEKFELAMDDTHSELTGK